MKDLIIRRPIALTFILLACFSYSQGVDEHVTCNRTYTKIECFKKDTFNFKMFDELIMTDRDWTAPQYGGQDIDWYHWDAYIHGCACRCMEKLKEKAAIYRTVYHHFSLQNYGECWSTKNLIYDLTVLTLVDTCVGGDFLACQRDSQGECMGTADSQYIYHIDGGIGPHESEELVNSQCHKETIVVCSSTTKPHHSIPTLAPTSSTQTSSVVTSTTTL